MGLGIIEANNLCAKEIVGGKGFQLQQLHSWGVNIAPFVIISTSVFEKVKSEGVIPIGIKNEIKKFIKNNGKIVLRSSMVGEDQSDASFAGLFETIFNLDESNWEKALLKIFESVESERVLKYIEKKKIKTSLKMAVVVQKEIQVIKSGVIFTRNPIPPTSLIAIDAAFGMGEGVVSGHADIDHIMLNRMGEIQARQGEEVLNTSEINQLYQQALKLEIKMACPSDIEWGFHNSKLYIFQIRPITRPFEALGVYADTNLSESYPGVVSPLTARFVQKAYENVFLESAEHLGMRPERIEKLKRHTKSLISCIDSHLYYNLEHYYAALRASPGGENNIKNWHKMIGGKIEDIEVPYHETSGNFFDNLLTALNFCKIAALRNQIFPDLLSSFKLKSDEIKRDIRNLASSTQTIFYLNQILNRRMNFGLTIINDFFIMIGLSVLEKSLFKRNLPPNLVVEILKTDKSVDSVRPLEAFQKLIGDLEADFIDLFISWEVPKGLCSYHDLFIKLSEKGYRNEVNKIQDFLDEYGDRSFEELKLESLPIKNDPKILQELMRWSRKFEINFNRSNLVHNGIFDINFSFFERWILRFTKDCIEYRESSRLWRGRFYHLYRELIIKLAHQLKSESTAFKDFELRDFFSINHEEWLSLAKGEISQDEILNFMKTRNWKSNTTHYPEFLITVTSEVQNFNHHLGLSNSSEMKGLGVSPGEASGVALVLDSPQDIFKYDYSKFILVTKNTDPAWVYIMSQSQGLISEKGSLLSHTAIIGRELGLPTIVGVKEATRKLKSGDLIRIDGKTGKIELL
jgi:phosphohistidine swiveling domain-containing protein